MAVYQKQMGITHDEFMRLLPLAIGRDDYTVIEKNLIRIYGPGYQSVDIMLGEESVRQIALMRIPTMPVEVGFVGYAEKDREAFMTLFDRAYQRGGG